MLPSKEGCGCTIKPVARRISNILFVRFLPASPPLPAVVMEIDDFTTGWEKSGVFAAARLFRSHTFQGDGGTPPPERVITQQEPGSTSVCSQSGG